MCFSQEQFASKTDFLPRLERLYERFLTFALTGKRPGKFILGTIGLLFLSFVLMAVLPPKIDFFPVNQPNYTNIFISHPIGTDISVTNETTLEVEEKVNEIIGKYMDEDDTTGIPVDRRIIQSVIAQVGEGTSDPAQGVAMGNTPHKGRVTVNFVESQYRNGIETSQILKEIQDGLRNQFTADIQITASKDEQGPPQGAPVNIEVTGRGEYKDLIIESGENQGVFERTESRWRREVKTQC